MALAGGVDPTAFVSEALICSEAALSSAESLCRRKNEQNPSGIALGGRPIALERNRPN